MKEGVGLQIGTKLVAGTVTVTGSAAPLTGNLCSRVLVKAGLNNANPVYIGGNGVTTANGYPLFPGDEKTLYVYDTNTIYVVGTDGSDTLSYLAET